MTEGFASIIRLLEQQKTAIDRALMALREVNGATTAKTPESAPVGSSQKQYKLGAAARERMSQGQRRRYAHLHNESVPATAATPTATETSGRKGKKRTAAQRRRMAEGQRKRYANLRGASEPAVVPAPEAPTAKRKISPEGIKKIVAATKRRWAKVRAEAKAAQDLADAKKAARKKAAPARAVKKSAPVKKTAPVAAADEVPF